MYNRFAFEADPASVGIRFAAITRAHVSHVALFAFPMSHGLDPWSGSNATMREAWWAAVRDFRAGRMKSDDTGRVPPNLNASLGLLLPAYWGGKGPTMLTTEWRRIAQFAQTLPISVVTSSCCWPAAAERAALSSLHDAGVQLLFYVPTLDPTAYKSGKIVCCDSYENITRHVDEVFAEARKPSGHTGLIDDFGIFFDVEL